MKVVVEDEHYEVITVQSLFSKEQFYDSTLHMSDDWTSETLVWLSTYQNRLQDYEIVQEDIKINFEAWAKSYRMRFNDKKRSLHYEYEPEVLQPRLSFSLTSSE